MNIASFLSRFLIATIFVVQLDLTTSFFIENDFFPGSHQFDPFDDPYLRTVLRMDIKTLMKIPIIDDITFISQLNEHIFYINGSVIMEDRTVLNDTKLDEQLIAQHEIEETWEELVGSGPIIVNYVGNLMVLSSKKDFAFIPTTPNFVYNYIKYPNSFRTTLVQIAHEIYNAFMNAHTNMDRIQLNMQQIPNHLKTILKLLSTASPRLIQLMLPNALGNIERIAKQCADSANSTLQIFNSMAGLLQEVTEVTIETYGVSAEVLSDTISSVNSSLIQQQELNSELTNIREKYDEARKLLEKAREDYYTAFHAIPTKPQRFVGLAIFGAVLGGSLVCAFTCGNRNPPATIDNTAFENAKAKAELALEELRKAEVEYDKWYSQMLEKQNKLTSIIIGLSQLNMEQTDLNTTIKILSDATKEITELQKQWTNMTRFFSALSIRAEATREIILHEFISNINEVMINNGVLDDADREFFVAEMLDTADQIDRDAHLLYIMAKTYYDVSGQYMINQISEFIGFAVTQTDKERQELLKRLANDTLSTSSKVSRMALERKQQYNQRNQARQNEYKQFIQQLIVQELESSIGK